MSRSDGIAYELLRFRNREEQETTVYLLPRETTRLVVHCFTEPTRLDHWCAA